MTTLDARSVTLRPWEPTDVAALSAIANDRRIWQNLRDRFPHPYGEAEAIAWIGFVSSQPLPTTNFAITLHGEVIGGIGLERFDDVHRRTAEIGYWLGAAHWVAATPPRPSLRSPRTGFEALELERIQAGVYEWNPASGRVLVKAGYQLEGRLRRHVCKDGRVGDVLLYATVREGHEAR